MKECMGAIENHESMSGDGMGHLTRSVKAAPKNEAAIESLSSSFSLPPC